MLRLPDLRTRAPLHQRAAFRLVILTMQRRSQTLGSLILSLRSCSSEASCADVPRPVYPRKGRARRDEDGAFVDQRNVRCEGGNGGDGCLSFLRIFNNAFAGADGGDGGNGAHVIFQATSSVTSLCGFPAVCRGPPGVPGKDKKRTGANAHHLILRVPLGTIVRPLGSEEILTDLCEPDDIFIAAKGGAGGKGNNFYMSNEVRAPLKTEAGGRGEVRSYNVELRSIADGGLVGFPNAGKSTLLRAVSRASPRVAGVPFTTLRPHIGVVGYEDHRQLRLADLPGLVDGAAQGFGLGHQFLCHVQRCPILFFLLDLSLGPPKDQLDALCAELEAYEPGLSRRPAAVIANKIDLPMSAANLRKLEEITHLPVFPISAKQRIGLDPLLMHFRKLFDEHNKTAVKERSSVGA